MVNTIKNEIIKFTSGIINETKRVIVGWYRLKKIIKNHEKGTHIIFLRGATGDIYIQLSLLKVYLTQNNIKNFILVSDAGSLNGLKKIFSISEYEAISVYIAECIEKAYLFLDGAITDMHMFFLWSNGFKHNKCCVRMTDKFNFMDSYKIFALNLKEPIFLKKPTFIEVTEAEHFWWQKRGIVPKKTVIVAPDANSVTRLPIWFWNSIIMDIKQKGYTVFVNCNYFNFYRAEDMFFSYEESVPLLEYCGYFVGIRSGLCDIISTAKCKKIIIYPKQQKEIDYGEHRTELEFSGLKVMGLANDDKDLIELVTPLIRNITDKHTMLEGIDDYFNELIILRERILKEF